MPVRRKAAKKILAAALSFIVAAAFTFALPDEAFAASKKCKTAKITYAKSTACNKISLKYAAAGKGTKPSTYFVYIKTPGGKYKLAAKTSKKTFTAAKLKASTSYTFKVRTAKAYKQKQYYNTKTKKWQTKKPKKKYWKGKKTRKVLKYKWFSKYSKTKTVKTMNHSYSLVHVPVNFLSKGTTSGKCRYCSKKYPTQTFGTPGWKQDLSAAASLVKINDTAAGALVSWTKAAGAIGYIVERSVDSGEYTDVYYSSSLNYVDEDISLGKTYCYRVTAYIPGGKSWCYGGESETDVLSTAGAVLADLPANDKTSSIAVQPTIAAPEDLTATPSYTSVKLTWKAAPKAKRYAVYCGEEQIGETTETTFTATELTPKTEYMFTVRALRDTLIGLTSDEVTAKTTAVPAPKNIKADAGWDSVTLRWDAVNGAEKYSVKTPPESKWVDTLKTTYTASELEPNKVYTFYVEAYVKGNWSDAGKTTAKTGFQAPGNLGVTYITDTTAILSWDPVDGADSYRIYKENGTSVVATTSDCSYKITGLSGNKTYSFYVAAGKDGTYGLLDDTNKVTFTTVLEQEGFIPNENITMTYGNATFYLGQNWSPSLESSLKAASNGFEKVSRPGYAHELLTYTTHAATEYFFDIEDYSDFLAVKVADGKIIGWETNGLLFGVYYGKEVAWGDSTMDYPYGSESGYRNSFCVDILTDIEQGDTVIGGFSFLVYPRSTLNIESEKKVGYHYINAYRGAAGLPPLQYSDALDGHDYTWTGEAKGKNWTNVRFGAQPLAETIAANKDLTHATENLTAGPLAGMTNAERQAIILAATGETRDQEIISTGGIGESCLGAYLNTSTSHFKQIISQSWTRVGIGIYGGYNAVQFGR